MKSSDVERHCVRFISMPISQVPSRRCLRNATRAAVRPQPSSRDRPGSQRSCRPRFLKALGDRDARAHLAAQDLREPSRAGQALMKRIHGGLADDLALVREQAQPVAVERQRRALAEQPFAVLAPEPLPLRLGVEIADRDPAADVDERRLVPAGAQRVDEAQRLGQRRDALAGS